MAFRSQDLKYLVDEHGKSLTLTAKGDPTYNTSTGGVSRSETTHTVKGYFYNYTLSEMDGSEIQRSDRRLVINLVDTSGSAIPEPETGDEFSGEGDKVSVIRVSKIMSGSSAVCYMCQVRE